MLSSLAGDLNWLPRLGVGEVLRPWGQAYPVSGNLCPGIFFLPQCNVPLRIKSELRCMTFKAFLPLHYCYGSFCLYLEGCSCLVYGKLLLTLITYLATLNFYTAVKPQPKYPLCGASGARPLSFRCSFLYLRVLVFTLGSANHVGWAEEEGQ